MDVDANSAELHGRTACPAASTGAAGPGWTRLDSPGRQTDDGGPMPSLRGERPDPDPPDPICPRCSKPILPGSSAQIAGRAVHMRCVARATQLNAIEQQDRARREAERASEAIIYARELVNTARRRTTRCPACGQPFTSSGGVLFQGDELVHAACWREDPKPFDDPPPPA